MSHCPDSFEYLPNFPLVALSGHTHGGQIAPFGLRLILPPGSGNYAQGWYAGTIRGDVDCSFLEG